MTITKKIKTMDPMMDFVFKALFGKEDKTSKELLMALLNDILSNEKNKKIVEVHHINPFNYKDFEGDKLSILDIKAKLDNGEIVNIEVQVKKEDDYRKRSLYYWSKSYCETILESEVYSNLKKTIVVNIMDYLEVKETNRIHTIFKIMENQEYFELLDDLEIHYLELPKLLNKETKELDNIELWLDFLKEAGKEGNELRLNELMERSDSMKIAINKLEEISADERMRELYRGREKFRLDMVSKLKYAENKGKEEGRTQGKAEGRVEGRAQGKAEGRAEEKIEIAKKLLLIGMTSVQVSMATDLSIEEIEVLEKEGK